MPRLRSAAVLVLTLILALALVSCNDDEGPTAPSNQTSLLGTWTGTMSVNRTGAATATCALRVTLAPVDSNVLVGDWQADCPDGASGRQTMTAVTVFNLVTLNAAGTSQVLDGCAWGMAAQASNNRLSGDWTRANNSCAGSPIQGGTVSLRKV
jgi:hypothetical protein